MTTVIITRQLTRRFGPNVAVDSLSLDIMQGEIFGFLGHNGAGKTTTVRLINGVLTPSAGEVRVFGLDPFVDGAKVRARTGVLTETPALDDRLTARDTLLYFAELYGVPRPQVRTRVDELLGAFDLSDRATDKIGSFSKGMRQRMAVARTVLHDPEIVFLDEPTSGLDPAATRDVHRMIERLRDRRRTVFLATHNLNEAERLCDRVAVLARGRVLATGSTRALAAQLEYGHRVVVEVDSSAVTLACHILAATPRVTKVEETREHMDDKASAALLCVHGAGRESVPQMVAALTQAGVNIYRIEPDEPSLEDVYFALEHE